LIFFVFVKDGLVYVLKENRGIKRMSDRSLPQHEYQNVEPGVFLKASMSETPEAIKIMESNNINNTNNNV
jgi:hypothetical protein